MDFIKMAISFILFIYCVLDVQCSGNFEADYNNDHDVMHGSGYFAAEMESLPFEVVPVPAVPVTSPCTAFIDYYGELAANFTMCVVRFARPLRVCENCVVQYLRASSAFDFVMKGKHKDDAGNDCGQMVLNSDRIQIIVRTQNFIKSMWEECSCNNCFDFARATNDSIAYRLANDTMTFNHLADDMANCFHNHTHHLGLNPSINSTVCKDCLHLYTDMNLHYEELNNKYDHHICMDIVDEMNSTRLMWSKTYGCSRVAVNPIPVFIVSGLFALLPVLFYAGNKIQVTRSQRKSFMNQIENSRPTTLETETEGETERAATN